MQIFKLENMTRGWFVGNFEPSVLKSKDVGVGVKEYQKGDCEQKHYHRIATEIAAIIRDGVKMNGIEYQKGDIIVIEPNEASDFKALEDTISVVVKMPCVLDDKYLGEVKWIWLSQ